MANQETSADWICETCVHYPPSSFGGKPCALCNPDDPMMNGYQRREEQPQTNGDVLRAMSDEELATWMTVNDVSAIDLKTKVPYEKWLDWLQNPNGFEIKTNAVRDVVDAWNRRVNNA